MTVRVGGDPLRLTVVKRAQPADRIVSLVLMAEDARPLPAWEPGAHIDLMLPDGRSRPYSLCGRPGQADRYEIAVQRETDGQSRGGSPWIHDHLREGDTIPVRPPRNNFTLEPAGGYRFIAGGIGITPLIGMLEQVASTGAPWSLTYGARTRAAMAFLPRLAAHGARVTLLPEDLCGRPDLTALVADLAPEELLYVCGPAPLISGVREAAAANGREAALRFELFSAPADDAPPSASAKSFEVVLRRTGITLDVGADETVLERLIAAGVPVFSDCEEGICGSCECSVLEGEIDHRDHWLSEAERKAGRTMMVCVSRARGRRIVLDL